ncbi:MAG: class I SAM-dependent methyltransferase [Alphaproteobacteria bacterium]|nr:class I SAM-dependent methyltransferase [Alphaproteobacteria bacterium SS10]
MFFGKKRQAAAPAAPVEPAPAEPEAEPAAPAPAAATADLPNQFYLVDPPHHQHGFDLFKGEWSSDVPGYDTGHATLFDDARLNWIAKRCGGYADKTILELGPLEAGHTYIIAKEKPKRLLSLEANTRAFLKCLVAANALRIDAEFMLGDFVPYLGETEDRFDLLVASGVLYHMKEPFKVIEGMARVADRIGIWTHYYDPNVATTNQTLAQHISTEPQEVEFHGQTLHQHRYDYEGTLGWAGFCGGTAPFANWVPQADIVKAFDLLGFDTDIGNDQPDHAHGACMMLYAQRR